MKFQKGNELWRLADPSNVGRPRNFETPQDLWNECVKYFEHVDSNPIIKKTTSIGDKGSIYTETEYKRPYTWEGMYVFLNVQSLDRYKKNIVFVDILTRIKQIIYSQKFEGAAAGVFNANIIARDLGLKDNTDITSKGESISNDDLRAAWLESLKGNDSTK
jgi:hypothetical protein